MWFLFIFGADFLVSARRLDETRRRENPLSHEDQTDVEDDYRSRDR
jgi:hypothetical protein